VIPDPRLRAGLTVLAAVVIAGTAGYIFIEGMTGVGAFYMTAITVSTVGFGEVGGDLGTGGKVFTVGAIILGMGGTLCAAAVGIERGLDRLLGGVRKRRRMDTQISRLNGHVILCGFGRVGSTTWRELETQGVQVVAIEVNPEAAATARAAGAMVVEGDATHDEVLTEAGIDRARAVISAARVDSDNIAITL
jgi:voltage-gated potassium channel